MIHDPRNIQLTPEQQQQIADLAERTGHPWERVVESALNQYGRNLARPTAGSSPENARDALKRLGLLGAIKGGPTDLSTNPKYMEGFGESE
ncbi:hypothetical protein NA78x_005585 [Anatilimnocola sp. NA78]|uniref:hypothetical protein n=1 Tax=Anatilimnocola sp. NA78 TaxID=3415683 RepID=UPI003CE58C2F